jgi:hypothetical protein
MQQEKFSPQMWLEDIYPTLREIAVCYPCPLHATYNNKAHVLCPKSSMYYATYNNKAHTYVEIIKTNTNVK